MTSVAECVATARSGAKNDPVDTRLVRNVVVERESSSIESLQAKFGLTYHVPYALQGDALVGLRGKRILEVGGSLPRGFVLDELGAAQWVGIEEMEYWQSLPPDGGGTRPESRPRRRLGEL